jgi:hypothetical protein
MRATLLFSDYQRFNPFRSPEWRFERVLQLCDRTPSPGRCTRRDDATIRTARNFLLRWRQRGSSERSDLFVENPGLYYAYEIHEKVQDDPDAALLLQARILAGMDDATIAQETATLPATVAWYESLFFQVRDRLQHRDWITKHVLLPAMARNDGLAAYTGAPDAHRPTPAWAEPLIARPFLDRSLKFFAYFGGPLVCAFLIHGFQSGKICRASDDLPRYFDDHWAVTIKARSAQAARAFLINKFNVMELFQTHAHILEIEKSEESLDQKRTQIEQHLDALLREFRWQVGEEGESPLVGTPFQNFEQGAVELRDAEILRGAAGQEVALPEDLQTLTMPSAPAAALLPAPPAAQGGSTP